MNRMKCAALILFLALILGGCSGSRSLLRDYIPAGEVETGTQSVPETKAADRDIYVHVCGCVRRPDVYCLPEGSRGIDAIRAAGGFTKDASRDSWNLAAVLEDGMQITVPSEKDTEAGTGGSVSGAAGKEGLVDINRASAEEFRTLPGIGESRAQEIVAYREEHGPFSSVEDIKNVSGIGDGIFTRIKDHITVS